VEVNSPNYLMVDSSSQGLRIDRFLSEVSKLGTRSQVTKWINDGHVSIDGRLAKPSQKLKEGQSVKVQTPSVEVSDLHAYDFPLNIVYEDEDVIVVDKPAGLVVHPAAGHKSDTLVNALLFHTKSLSSGGQPSRPGIVHRIDKDTSGLIVVAKNNRTHEKLALQFKDKTVHRVYRALCWGRFEESRIKIDAPVGRHPTDRKKFSTRARTGKRAVTHLDVEREHECGLALVKLKLETGRTHQIRVHLQSIGHPIVGDRLYGWNAKEPRLKVPQVKTAIQGLNRFFLHAQELGFEHPTSKKFMSFSAPIPLELTEILTCLGWHDIV